VTPSGDEFTSELCQFLSSLATTSEASLDDLAPQLVKLKEVLLRDVVQDQAPVESESGEAEDDVSESGSSTSTEKSEDNSVTSKVEDCNELTRTQEVERSENSHSQNLDLYQRDNYRVMFSIQKGARWEMQEIEVKRAFSKFGRVNKVYFFQGPSSGNWGFVEFRVANTAKGALNKLVQVGHCWLHTSLPLSLLTNIPVPYQILLESRYLPRIWEKEIVLKTFFGKYGCVNAVVFLGFNFKMKMQRFVVSFKEAAVAQKLIGTTVKILTCDILVKEVSADTLGNH